MTDVVARDTAERHGTPKALEVPAADEGQEGAKTRNQALYQVLPDLAEEEYRALKADISVHGIHVPIEVDEQGNILDGHHRVKAARELGLPDEASPRVVRKGLSDEEKLEHVPRLNLLRRHLTREQKQALAVQLRQRGWTQERIAAVLGVSQQTVSNWLRDVTKPGNVDADSGKPALPLPITGALGRGGLTVSVFITVLTHRSPF